MARRSARLRELRPDIAQVGKGGGPWARYRGALGKARNPQAVDRFEMAIECLDKRARWHMSAAQAARQRNRRHRRRYAVSGAIARHTMRLR